MGVATHLGISLAEYDKRIRTFIPDYEEMLKVAASAVPARVHRIVDLGTGTGALAARCLRTAPSARIFGIDADPGMLAGAERRLRGRAELVTGDFAKSEFPPCDAVVASFALHHVRTHAAKEKLYRKIRMALRPGGVLVNVDCQPARDRALRDQQMDAWKAHLMRSYSRAKAAEFLADWSKEDVYIPLEDECDLLRRSGFAVEILWRSGAFAVLAAKPRRG